MKARPATIPANARARTRQETYGPSLEKALRAFAEITPGEAATLAGTRYEKSNARSGQFIVPFLSTPYHVLWPEGTVLRAQDWIEADIATRILLLHYLLGADGTPVSGTWVAFRSLPGGLGYDAAFNGRACLPLARRFGSDGDAFETAARRMCGEGLTYGDASFLFRVLPRVWLAAVIYLADEEFPAAANVLFDRSASHYLPTEDLAVLAGLLTRELVKGADAR